MIRKSLKSFTVTWLFLLLNKHSSPGPHGCGSGNSNTCYDAYTGIEPLFRK